MRRTSDEVVPGAGAPATSRAHQSRPSIQARDVILAIAGIVVSIVWATGIAVPSRAESVPPGDTDALGVWTAMIGLIAGSLVHTLVHEVGHVLAATAMRLRIVSVRVGPLRLGRPDEPLSGTSGHVAVELPGSPRWLPVRMIVFSLGGPAANIAVALATATLVVADRSASTSLRLVAVGFAVAGFVAAIANLVPTRPRHHHETDGHAALEWILRPSAARARAGGQTLRGPRPGIPLATGTATAQQRRDHLLSEIGNPHPDIAVAAITELFRSRPRWDDGWQDVEVVATFAARVDIAADVRAKASSQYGLSLAVAHLVSLRQGESNDPESPNVRRMERLADLALAADRESLQARTAMALVRIIQGRPSQARALLTDVDASASPLVRARAAAVLGIAEIELGGLDQARVLAATARKTSPTDPVVKLLHARLSSTASA